MLLSAVICTYNRRYLLEDQISAIEAMPGWHSGDFEVIYVDNNSKDGTYEALLKMCESRPQIRVVQETQQGSSAARDRGAREAHGEFVWFMDDDSVPHPSTLRVYLEALPRLNPKWQPARLFRSALCPRPGGLISMPEPSEFIWLTQTTAMRAGGWKDTMRVHYSEGRFCQRGGTRPDFRGCGDCSGRRRGRGSATTNLR